jgi:hypothetical protein
MKRTILTAVFGAGLLTALIGAGAVEAATTEQEAHRAHTFRRLMSAVERLG